MILDRAAARRVRSVFCFASTPLPNAANSKPRLTSDAECCRAQEIFEASVATLHRDEAHRSITGKVLVHPLAGESLFPVDPVCNQRAAGTASCRRRPPLSRHVARNRSGRARSAVAMMFFPLMSQASSRA